MSKITVYFGIVLAFLLTVSQINYAVDISNMADHSTLRCRGGIVATGDSERTVMDKCGDPLEVQRLQDVGPVWIYNIGLSKFMYYLAFHNGRLQRIVSAPCDSNNYECFDLR